MLSQFGKRRYHRRKAHLILSALLRRGAQEDCDLVFLESYRELRGAATVAINPTSFNMRKLVQSLQIEVLPARGFVASESDWQDWLSGRKGSQLRLEEFYRWQRTRLGLLMDADGPVGGRWNYDADNRLGAREIDFEMAEPWLPREDDYDTEAREILEKLQADGQATFVGLDGRREFAASQLEAQEALQYFISHRLSQFGPAEDAILQASWSMSHSLLSVPLNLGLLDPLVVAKRAELAYRSGASPIASVEGFVRQVVGWRDYVWHLYWHFGEKYVESNNLSAKKPLPDNWLELESESVNSACLAGSLNSLKRHGWLHHIERLMILGNVALQRGYDPIQVNDWFIDSFVDGTSWVMPANVIGMTLFADGGLMSTKPYAAGGAYINRMSDYCGSCIFKPDKRVGPDACPMTAGYWYFLDKHKEILSKNPRILQQLHGLKRLKDVDEIRHTEAKRESL